MASEDYTRDSARTYGRTWPRTVAEPSLFLNFTSATALDPRITFSRGSQATLFDSTGTLVYAKQNVLLQSQDFSTTWSVASQNASITTNTAVAPDGTTTADTITDDATSGIHRVSQSVTTSSTTQLVFSVFAKYSTMQWIGLSAATATSAWAGAKFDIQNGVLGSTSQQGTGWAANSSSITPVGNGWYRCVLVFTPGATGATTFLVNCATDGTTFTASQRGSELYSGTGSSAFIWGAQLNIANMEGGVTSSLTTYYPTTTAAYYAPRFDYNPSTLQPRGLLIEEQRTNLFPASNDFANATYWTVYGTAVATAGAGTGPDGLNSAVNLAGATNTTLGGDNIEEVITVSASTAYEFSVFVKSNGGTTVTLRLRDSTGGSTSSAPFTVTSSWTRISLNRTMAAGATSVRCIIGATDGNILIYGAQTEAGAFATSYIPTTTTALTRNADVATMTGTNFSSWYNAAQGTIVANTTVLAVAPSTALQGVFAINDGTADNRMAVYKRANADVSTRFDVTAATINSCFLNAGTFTTTNRVAAAYATDNFAAVLNGGSPATDTGGAVPTVTQINIGSYVGATSFLNGHIQRLSFYPQRLPNTTLQALTA